MDTGEIRRALRLVGWNALLLIMGLALIGIAGEAYFPPACQPIARLECNSPDNISPASFPCYIFQTLWTRQFGCLGRCCCPGSQFFQYVGTNVVAKIDNPAAVEQQTSVT